MNGFQRYLEHYHKMYAKTRLWRKLKSHKYNEAEVDIWEDI